MEKFYIVSEESKLRKDYFDYSNNAKKVNEHVINFMKEHNIEAHQYIPYNEQLLIIPTENDLKLYSNILGQPNSEARGFKKNSKINKEWVKSLKDNNLKVLSRPYLGFYFGHLYGRHATRLFHHENVVYCSLESDCNFTTPTGFIEIKASEFFKILEEN